MLKSLAAFALAATLAAPFAAPAALADGTTPRAAPEKRPAPLLKRSPTDETRTVPRARGIVRGGTDTLTYSYETVAPPSLLEPGAGPARPMIDSETRYYNYAPVAPDFDGAPCPTRSSTSLGELFACTWR